MRPPAVSGLARRLDLLAAWNPERPVAANLVFVLFVAALEIWGRGPAAAAGAGAEAPVPLTLLFAALWIAYPLALHVKLPLIADASEAGRTGRLADGWQAALLVGGLLMSTLTLLVVITSLGLDLDHPLAPLSMIGGVGHGLAVAFLYAEHLATARPGEAPERTEERLAWRRRLEWAADGVLIGYVFLAYSWTWEGLFTGRTPSLAGYGWPAVLPQLIAAVCLFWIVYLPLQAPFLLGLAGGLEARRGGAWRFRASCLLATLVGLWPCFQ